MLLFKKCFGWVIWVLCFFFFELKFKLSRVLSLIILIWFVVKNKERRSDFFEIKGKKRVFLGIEDLIVESNKSCG